MASGDFGGGSDFPVPIGTKLRRTMRAPGGFGAMITAVPSVIEEALAAAAVAPGAAAVFGSGAGTAGAGAAGSGAAGAVVVGGETVGTGIVAFFGGWIIVIILLVILLLVISLRMVEFLFYKVADHMPFGIGSDQIRGITGGIFGPIDSLEDWVANHLVGAMTAAINGLYFMLHTAVLFIVGDTSVFTPASEQIHIRNLETEYKDLYRKYNYVEHQIKTINDTIGGTGTQVSPTPVLPPVPGTVTNVTEVIREPIPQALLDRITRLENHLVQTVHNLNVLHGDYNTLAHNETALHEQVAAIATALGGIRATQYGVQSTMLEFQQLIVGVQHELGDLAPKVDAGIRQLHLMQPLEQLLYLGQPGINTLKKLEQDPCQCPSYPNLPSDQSEALAVYGFMSHG